MWEIVDIIFAKRLTYSFFEQLLLKISLKYSTGDLNWMENFGSQKILSETSNKGVVF